jgi:protocatechuate 3,4-dioxygenase beta subunit
MRISRRGLLSGASAAAAGLGVAWFARRDVLRWLVRRTHNGDLDLTAAPAMGTDLCVVTSSQVEGPFFIRAPHRSDLREDRPGRRFDLELEVVSMPDCQPVAGAIVEIWHCDAEGTYSGYPEGMAHDLWKTLMVTGTGDESVAPVNEARFLRGAQVTGRDGRVAFRTVFPGWYEPRAPHVHFKVVAGEREYLTSQFYFEPAFCDRLYTTESPYSRYGACPYRPENDIAIAAHERAHGLLLRPLPADGGGLRASARIGLALA